MQGAVNEGDKLESGKPWRKEGLAQETTDGQVSPGSGLWEGLVLGMERHNNKIIITVSNKFKCFMALLLTHNKIKMLGTC